MFVVAVRCFGAWNPRSCSNARSQCVLEVTTVQENDDSETHSIILITMAWPFSGNTAAIGQPALSANLTCIPSKNLLKLAS